MSQRPEIAATLLDFWYMALAQPVGIVLQSENPKAYAQQLYQARSAFDQRYEIDGLSICMSPTSDTELWIIHKEIKVEKSAETPEAHA
jgi:hypothetical protein